jgi:hypothetical protein
VLPAETPAFSRYALVFSREGYESVTIDNAADLAGQGVSQELETGDWTATVTAYRTFTVGTEPGEYEAARGSVSIKVQAGETTQGTVPLAPLPVTEPVVKGIFTYKVTFPDGADGTLIFGSESEVTLTSGTEVSVEKDPGYYDLYIVISKGSLSAGRLEKAHIYAGLESKADYTFVEDDFTATVYLAGTLTMPEGVILSTGTVTAYADPEYAEPLGLASVTEGGIWSIGIAAAQSGSLVYFKAEAEDSGGTVYQAAGDSGEAVTLTGKRGIALVAAAAAVPLTADIEFVATKNNSSGLDEPELEVVDAATQAWTIAVPEKAVMYFAVNKEAGQTITVTGTDADRVSQAEDETTVDGSTAGPELAVFTVATERWDAETRTSNLFYGTGDFTIARSTGNVADTSVTLSFAPVVFNIEVSEQDHDSKTVSVTVNVEPDLTGVAVFKVESDGENGTLTRTPPEDVKKWNDTNQAGINLIDGIAKVDTDDTGGGEWLIRVEHDEAMPKVFIRRNYAVAATEIRLRGIGTEREISHDGSTASQTTAYASISSNVTWTNMYGFINLSTYNSAASLTLALEDKVTLKGLGFDATAPAPLSTPTMAANDPYKYWSMVYISIAHFIMRAGSRITGYNTTSDYMQSSVIWCNEISLAGVPPRFQMKGGSIDHNKLAYIQEYDDGGTIVVVPQSTMYPTGGSGGSVDNILPNAKATFVKTGGTVADNVCIIIETGLEDMNFPSLGVLLNNSSHRSTAYSISEFTQ